MSPDDVPTVILDDGTLRIALHKEHDEVVVRIGGELDVSSRDAHNLVLEQIAQSAGDTKKVVVDMQNVRFCDSTGIVLLLRVQQQTEGSGGKFALREPSAAVSRVLIAGGLRDLLEQG
jgi:anti-anti-sigma factor